MPNIRNVLTLAVRSFEDAANTQGGEGIVGNDHSLTMEGGDKVNVEIPASGTVRLDGWTSGEGMPDKLKSITIGPFTSAFTLKLNSSDTGLAMGPRTDGNGYVHLDFGTTGISLSSTVGVFATGGGAAQVVPVVRAGDYD